MKKEVETEHESAIRLANKLLDEPYADPDDDLRLLARQFLRAKEMAARIVVDLYEMRASTMLPYKPEHFEKVHDAFKYQFFSSAIAQLCDKYKIPHEDIQEIIRHRTHEQFLSTKEKQNE